MEDIAMETLNRDKLKKISVEDFLEEVRLHELWLNGNKDGKKLRFKNIDFTRVNFDNLNLERVVFDSCYFPNTHFGNCNCKKTEFYVIESSGFFASNSDFTKSKIVNMKAEEVSFHRCNLTDMEFWDSDFNKIDFSWSKLDKTEFNHCKFNEMVAEGTRFLEVEGLVVLGVQWTDGYRNKTLYYIPKYDLISSGDIYYGYSCTMSEFEEELEEYYEEDGLLTMENDDDARLRDRETLLKAVQYLKEEAERQKGVKPSKWF